MRNKLFAANSSGFSVIEILVALGITVVGSLAAYQLLSHSDTFTKRLNAQISGQIDEKLGSKYLIRDLRQASPSMNVLNVKDDKNLNFYDYEPDRSSDFYKNQKEKTRRIRLSATGKKVFYMLIEADKYGSDLFTDPITFFQQGPTPASLTEPSTLNYIGIDAGGYLSKNGPSFSSPDVLIFVDSSVLNTSSTSKRVPVFVGRFNKKTSRGGFLNRRTITTTDIEKVSFPDGIFDYQFIDATKNLFNPTSFSDFLLNLPPVGANGASLRLKPVKLIKYELVCDTNCDLYRSDVTSLSQDSNSRSIVVRDCKEATFFRSDISSTIVKIDMTAKVAQ